MNVTELTEEISRLVRDGVDEDEAITRVLERCDAVSATIMTPGSYVYGEDTGKFQVIVKRPPDIKKMVGSHKGKYVPVHETHDGVTHVTGVAHGFEYDEQTGKARARITTRPGHELQAGDGVSPGFYTKEVACGTGTCQTEMRLEHIAASASLEPRGDENRVDARMADDKEMAAKIAVLEKEIEKRDATIEQYKQDSVELQARIDSYQTAERDALVHIISPHVKETFKFDGMSLDELKRLKLFTDSLQPTTDTGTATPFSAGSENSTGTKGNAGILKGTGW